MLFPSNDADEDKAMMTCTGTGECSQCVEDLAVDPSLSEVDLSPEDTAPSQCTSWRVSVPLILIALIGAGISAAFLVTGIQGAHRDQRLTFEKHASELIYAVQSTWKDYHLGGLWIQESCRSTRTLSSSTNDSTGTNTTSNSSSDGLPKCSRQDFRGLYEYMITGGLDFQSISYVPNVTHQYRAALEEEAKQYYKKTYPTLHYMGITGFSNEAQMVASRATPVMPEKPFYFPQHFLEPIKTNERYIDFDMYSTVYHFMIDAALRDWRPLVSGPIPSPVPGGNQVMLLHPGAPLSNGLTGQRSTGLACINIPFSAVIQGAIQRYRMPEEMSIYIFDTTEQQSFFQGKHSFFGGAKLPVSRDPSQTTTSPAAASNTDFRPSHQTRGVGSDVIQDVSFTTDTPALEDLRKSSAYKFYHEHQVAIEQQTWTVLVVALEGTYEPDLFQVILGGCCIGIVCAGVTVWLYSALKREAHIADIQRSAQTEKAALIVQSARKAAQVERQAAQAERHLNEYLSHEVRNPLSSAMASCSFLASSATEPQHQEDIQVIQSSLAFINDLLRSMLDLKRVESKQLTLDVGPTDVLKDLLEPVKTILHRRGNTYDIQIVCRENLVVMADRMRVKQVILNLASNSVKFVQQGYIRLSAEITPQGHLEIVIEDSGPGVPPTKRDQLFSRFQSSLDSLNQGTGMGLSLCKNLVHLMDGDLRLDDNFHSGIEGCPGARFVVSLPACTPVNLDTVNLEDHVRKSEPYAAEIVPNLAEKESFDQTATPTGSTTGANDIEMGNMETGTGGGVTLMELPEQLAVLLVDDDLVLRKLLGRSLKRVAPGWTIKEASNGETALQLVDDYTFELIFMDQYMASIDKQLLGTETTYALRAKGVEAVICGLSANDMEEAFLKAGANAFLQKPFSCDQQALKSDLLNVLNSGNKFDRC